MKRQKVYSVILFFCNLALRLTDCFSDPPGNFREHLPVIVGYLKFWLKKTKNLMDNYFPPAKRGR